MCGRGLFLFGLVDCSKSTYSIWVESLGTGGQVLLYVVLSLLSQKSMYGEMSRFVGLWIAFRNRVMYEMYLL